MANIAIFGSCVTRDAFELAAGLPQHHTIGLYLSRTTINACLSPPLRASALGRIHRPKFEERCVVDDLRKRHFAKLRRANCDYLIVDLIDERHATLEIEGSLICRSVLLGKLAARRGWSLDQFPKLAPGDPATLVRTLGNLPRFAARLTACVPAHRILVHQALWATNFLTLQGQVLAFSDQAAVAAANDRLRRCYGALIDLLPGCASITVPDGFRHADETHRWTLAPFHYAPPYYEAFMAQLDAIVG